MKRNQKLPLLTLKRDNFICKKCGLEDPKGSRLEAHHIIPICMGGKDEIENMITLCYDCHHFAPNKKEEFEEYMKEQCDGTMTTFLKAWKIIQEKHPELFNTQISNEQKRKVTSPLDTI